MIDKSMKYEVGIPRATGLLVITVENSNPNGDPDQESDPRRRSHDNRGMITGVSFKRKLRDLVLHKDTQIWQKLADRLHISHCDGAWVRQGYYFDILEDRELLGSQIKKLIEAGEKKGEYDAFQKQYWDGRVFGNTFLPEETKGNHVRSGVTHFGLAVSVSPVRIHRLTKTKMAPTGGRKEDDKGPSRGMAPLAHRVVENAIYTMPFFINPTGAQGKRGTGCTSVDILLLFELIRYAYPHTKSDLRPFVDVRHAWYAEHEDDLGSFSEFEFIELMRPIRKGGSEKPSVSGVPFTDQYDIPTNLPSDGDRKFRGKLKGDKLYDLCVELPEWCREIIGNESNA